VPHSRDSQPPDLYSGDVNVNYSSKNRVYAAGLRRILRHALDSMFCKSFKDKLTLGNREGAQWTLCVGGLNSNSIVYSGGVGGDISFEIELVKRFGLSVVIFDPSPIALETIRNHSTDPEMKRIEFNPVGLASESKSLRFEPSNVPGEWQMSVGENNKSREIACTTIMGEMARHGHKNIDLLKLDIEGFEYQVLNHCLDNHLEIGQICVEFHDFLPNIGRKSTLESILALRKHNFNLVHKQRHDFTFLKS
jgi:FkbM family methyltransferase